MGPKILESRLIYENRWLRLREDAIERADGAQGIYTVIEKPDFAVIAAIENDGLYLVEQFRYPVGGRYWELPQGAWEDAPNVDPLELAKAELAEETGLIAAEMRHIGNLFEAYGYSNQSFNIFLASALTAGQTNLDAEEADLISGFFSFAEVRAMIDDGRIKDGATIAALGLLHIKGLISF